MKTRTARTDRISKYLYASYDSSIIFITHGLIRRRSVKRKRLRNDIDLKALVAARKAELNDIAILTHRIRNLSASGSLDLSRLQNAAWNIFRKSATGFISTKEMELKEIALSATNILNAVPEYLRDASSSDAGADLKRLSKKLEAFLSFKETKGLRPKIYPIYPTEKDPENPRPGLDLYSITPFSPVYEDRKRAFLEECAERNPATLAGAVAESALGRKTAVPDDHVDLYAGRLDCRLDCADFFAVHVVTALYKDRKNSFLTRYQKDVLGQALLGFKYWLDEPGYDRMIFWTENHQILFHSVEYLAGQLFMDSAFYNNGETGQWHKEHAGKLALEWMERKIKWGYFEWDSNEYYAHDLEALLLLAEFSDDESMRRAASITIDLLLLDVACNHYRGQMGSTHGRSYDYATMSGWDDKTGAALKLLWGMGTFGDASDYSTLLLASAQEYTPPRVILDIGSDTGMSYESRERHGMSVEEMKARGISFDELDDLMILWEAGVYTNGRAVDLIIRAADKWDLWQHPFFDMFGELNRLLSRDTSIADLMDGLDFESDRTLLGEVNKVTYKTPDYMLSSAQDYRPGERGNQQHVWQATLGPNAVVFTTNPGPPDFWSDEKSPDCLDFRAENLQGKSGNWNRTPNHWTGHNRFPRVAQYRNLVVALYRIELKKAIGERKVYPYTHAFFPRWAFDEVHETGGWVFGRVEDGYAALYSHAPYRWIDAADFFAHEIRADGLENAWICIMGNGSEYGSYKQFRTNVLDSAVRVDGLNVEFDAPGTGPVNFSWDGPFTVDGKEIPLTDYKRFSNPFCEADFDSTEYVIEYGGKRLDLDFVKRIRREKTMK